MMIRLIKIFSLVLILNACGGNSERENRTINEQEHGVHEHYKSSKKYTCPMHPEIIKDEPGQCPICKMDLVEMKNEASKTTETELDILLKPTNKYVVSQVKTIRLKEMEVPVVIQATGKISYDTREIFTISSKVAGRIEKLYVKYKYQPVTKGQRLMDIYSKELLTEQENYIYLLKNDPENATLIKTAEERLMLQGLTSDQVKKIKDNKKAMEYITVYSSYSGHLHDLSGDIPSTQMTAMNSQIQPELLLKEGMYIQKGQAVFNVYSTNKLWALLNIYADNQSIISKGDKVHLFVDGENLGDKFKIDFIEPEMKPNQNTVTVRVYLSNITNAVKVGSNVKATINSGNKKGNFIPAVAVVDLGNNKVVFVRENNLFKAHKVITGMVVDNMVEVLSGLEESDEIAENAQLLMDSESFIRSTDNEQ